MTSEPFEPGGANGSGTAGKDPAIEEAFFISTRCHDWNPKCYNNCS